jgi:ATP-binding cassette subfamily B protein
MLASVLKRRKYPFFLQLDSMDCGPSCLRMIAKFFGKSYSLSFLREKTYSGRAGVNLRGLAEGAESIGFRTRATKMKLWPEDSTDAALANAPLPAILHWNQNHFVVLYKLNTKYAWIADPANGIHKISINRLKKSWLHADGMGISLLLKPSPEFYDTEGDKTYDKNLSFFIKYLRPHKNLVFQLFLGLILGTLFQLIFPFLTQSLVDIGIQLNDLNFIYIILFAQLALFVGQISSNFIQSWIMLHISTRININLIADFLKKLMCLPLVFFDAKNMGDLLQRIGDHKRVETFLTQSTVSVLLSIINMIVFGVVLAIYSMKIFLVFIISSILYVSWVSIFMKKRKEIDYHSFQFMSENQDSIIEMIQGMPDIKLQGSELKRRWKWANIQAKLFHTNINSLKISQYQNAGVAGISQLKDIVITFIAAISVMQGSLTLGAMLAIQYIIGQLNGPLNQMIGFIHSAQDALISLERLGEVHNTEDESDENIHKLDIVPSGDITLSNMNFAYSPVAGMVLKNINLTIPRGKTTAIVGTSGSGKTTLIKLLLGFYEPTQGSIRIGDFIHSSIDQKIWRRHCGVVMQEGFLFSDTIVNNIAECDDKVKLDRIVQSTEKANISDFIQSLPQGYNTIIGARGNGLSQGQKQRMLIARAIYKDPEFLFFDEATNALDAHNEKIIMDNIDAFSKGKTTVVVAHRLSTVKKADQIIVLDKGEIAEIGTHEELVALKGQYFTLVKNQLELAK